MAKNVIQQLQEDIEEKIEELILSYTTMDQKGRELMGLDPLSMEYAFREALDVVKDELDKIQIKTIGGNK